MQHDGTTAPAAGEGANETRTDTGSPREEQPAEPAPGRPAPANRAALLVLADGRFPAGGHAHSGGAEPAVAAGRITGAADLGAFCRGRLHTAGLVAAALAAAAAGGCHALERLDAAADARTPSPVLRRTARKLGRQMLRAARAAWPSPELDALARTFPRGTHQPLVLGTAARSAGLTPEDAAYAAAYESTTGPATAAVRLLGLDPYDATAVLARLSPEMDEVVERAVCAAREAEARLTAPTGPHHFLDPRQPPDPLDALPAASAPLLDITAERHAGWQVRLFAS